MSSAAPVPTGKRPSLIAQIASWRENLLDLDIVVDDCRRDVDRAVEDLRAAVKERDRAALHLAHLIAMHAEMMPPGASPDA
jgi:hypothetical protein